MVHRNTSYQAGLWIWSLDLDLGFAGIGLMRACIYTGIHLSAAAEIWATRWFWRRTKTMTPFQWLLCFLLGTRPSGRMFFWPYIFYLSRFLHLFHTFFAILRRRKLTFFRLFNHSILIFMSFLWLEFLQLFQVLEILLTTLLYSVVYGYHFWTAIGLPNACFPFVVNYQVILLGYNLWEVFVSRGSWGNQMRFLIFYYNFFWGNKNYFIIVNSSFIPLLMVLGGMRMFIK